MTTTRKVHISGLKLDAEIGVYDHEYDRKQPLIIDVEIGVRPPSDVDSESFDDVLCYHRFTESIRAIVNAGHIGLVETLGERICKIGLDHPLVLDIRVRISKPDAIEDAQSVGVEIYRRR